MFGSKLDKSLVKMPCGSDFSGFIFLEFDLKPWPKFDATGLFDWHSWPVVVLDITLDSKLKIWKVCGLLYSDLKKKHL